MCSASFYAAFSVRTVISPRSCLLIIVEPTFKEVLNKGLLLSWVLCSYAVTLVICGSGTDEMESKIT